MPSLTDLLNDALAKSRTAQAAVERATFNLNASSEHEVAQLEILERRAKVANDLVNSYLDQVTGKARA